MKKTLISMAIVVPALLSACASTGGGSDPTVKQLVAQAETEVAKAKSMNVLWSTTDKHLKEAQKASAELETEKAIKAAKKAIKEAQLAQQQAAAPGKPRYNGM